MTETKHKLKKDGTKDLGGRRFLGDIPQNEMFGFKCTPGSKEVWKSYADNLKLDQTELFYRMIHHLASQGDFISWFEQTQTEQVEKNREWFESWKMVQRCCENMVRMNDGRVKQIADKKIETKLVKEVSEVLHKHFDKKS
jgi:hypothetical protein